MEVLTITSESHATKFVQTFGELFNNNVLTDVTLVCDDQVRIDAHKIVLSAGSLFFREMFVKNPQTHPLLYLRGLKEEELLSLLQFLYLGETLLSKDRVPQFLSAAKEFKISGLEEQEITETENTEDQTEEKQNLKLKKPEPSQKKEEKASALLSVSTKVSQMKTGGEKYQCDICNFHAQSKSKLAEHKVAVHAVSCSHCNTKFQSEAAMVKHRRAKHEPQPAPRGEKVPEPKLACHQCRFVSNRMDLLREHVMSTHVNK